jgi:hypothetical protein
MSNRCGTASAAVPMRSASSGTTSSHACTRINNLFLRSCATLSGPANPVLFPDDKHGLRAVHFAGNRLHPRGICRVLEQADPRRVPHPDPVGKRIQQKRLGRRIILIPGTYEPMPGSDKSGCPLLRPVLRTRVISLMTGSSGGGIAVSSVRTVLPR